MFDAIRMFTVNTPTVIKNQISTGLRVNTYLTERSGSRDFGN